MKSFLRLQSSSYSLYFFIDTAFLSPTPSKKSFFSSSYSYHLRIFSYIFFSISHIRSSVSLYRYIFLHFILFFSLATYSFLFISIIIFLQKCSFSYTVLSVIFVFFHLFFPRHFFHTRFNINFFFNFFKGKFYREFLGLH